LQRDHWEDCNYDKLDQNMLHALDIG
jgi:hypothetical protein